LNEAGADTELMARAKKIQFHDKSADYRPLVDRIKNPRSVIGLGWRSKLAVDLPLLFHAMPQRLRHRVVQRHLGPAPGWFSRPGFEGHVTPHLGCALEEVRQIGDKVQVRYRDASGRSQSMLVDHVIAGTGFKPYLKALEFLSPELAAKVHTADDVPVLDSNFRSSVPGLYMTGLVSANNFGPMCRFACGARFTAKRLARHLARTAPRKAAREVEVIDSGMLSGRA